MPDGSPTQAGLRNKEFTTRWKTNSIIRQATNQCSNSKTMPLFIIQLLPNIVPPTLPGRTCKNTLSLPWSSSNSEPPPPAQPRQVEQTQNSQSHDATALSMSGHMKCSKCYSGRRRYPSNHRNPSLPCTTHLPYTHRPLPDIGIGNSKHPCQARRPVTTADCSRVSQFRIA